MTAHAADIINRLISYAGHNMKCKLNLRMGATDCTCDCWATITEAQEFLEKLDVGDIPQSSFVRVDYSSDGVPTYTFIPADEFYKLKGDSDAE